MNQVIRIGTRDSELALWQANLVAQGLERNGYSTALIPLKSGGDLNLEKPLYEFGITGIFTRTLDIALLNNTIDLAVHSLKDVPTALPKGLVQAAVLKRANPSDILVYNNLSFLEGTGIVATGSLRRKAQWLNRYADHQLVDLRGNVNTRLKKLASEAWDGAIFAAAGLERIGLTPENSITLEWMLPAPAQGAISISCRKDDAFPIAAAQELNCEQSAYCTEIEREFLRLLEGGCSAPVGCLAQVSADELFVEGGVFSLDGKSSVRLSKSFSKEYSAAQIAQELVGEVRDNGGAAIMEEIRKNSK